MIDLKTVLHAYKKVKDENNSLKLQVCWCTSRVWTSTDRRAECSKNQVFRTRSTGRKAACWKPWVGRSIEDPAS